MLSAIRKFFNRGGHHQKLEEQPEQLQKAASEKKLARKLQRQLKRQRRQDKRQAAASEAGAPLKGPPACGIVGSSVSGGSNSSSDGSGSSHSSDNSNENDSSNASSGGGSSSTGGSNSSNDDGGEGSCCREGETFANVVAMDGDNMAARQQQQQLLQCEFEPPQDADNSNGRTEGDNTNDRDSQQEARDPDDDDDEDLDEVDDFDDDDEEEEMVAFIAEAPNKQLHYQHLQQHHHQQQQSDRLTASCPQSQQAAAAASSAATTTAAAAVQQPRKTDVDQLLTGSTASAAQKRDSVRGNLEELRVAESVNYRPVVYKYSFRVADVPVNMRVFTDPDDRRIEAIARSCESQIHLEKLPIRGPGSLRMRKVTIQSPDLHSLEKCCRQFDDRFPHFYVSGGLGLSSKSIQRVYVDELAEQQQQQQY